MWLLENLEFYLWLTLHFYGQCCEDHNTWAVSTQASPATYKVGEAAGLHGTFSSGATV